MRKDTITRREVIRIMGMSLPAVLLGMEVLPGIARAQQSYTRLTYRVSSAKRDKTLTDWDEYEVTIDPYYDDDGNRVAMRVREVDDSGEGDDDIKAGDIIYKINDKPYIMHTDEDFANWSNDLWKMISDKQKITIDLDRDNKPCLYVFEFD